MKALGHYLKPGVRVSAPCVLFSVVVDPHVSTGARCERDTFYSWGGADVCVSYYRRGKWTAVKGARCETQKSLHRWMKEHAHERARNYVVSPHAAETLALAGIWDVIGAGPVKWVPPATHARKAKPHKVPDGTTIIRRIALGGRATILDYARQKLRWLWLSTGQYYGTDEETVAAAVGYQWDTGPAQIAAGTHTHRLAQERAAMWLKAMQTLCDWWRATAKAPFGLTASSLAMGMLRTHARPRELCTHSDPDVHRLERDACIGGRCSTWYYGDIGEPARCATDDVPAPAPSSYGRIAGPLTSVDVRSMYPWLLREREFPMSLSRHPFMPRPGDPQAYAECCGVIARVTIETDVPEYPMRSGDHIVYPVGRFTTTLTGPELLRLKADGKVTACHELALYRLGRPFRECAAALLEMREKSRRENNPGWELLAKTIANGLGGKMAQAKGQWVERPDIGPQKRFEEFYQQCDKTGRTSRFRAIAGCVWEYCRDKTGAGPHTSAFAYLAAYGRLHMREIRDETPGKSVVSMDTDGLWVLPDGFAALSARTGRDDGRAGGLRVVESVDAARFFGPRHYFAGGNWVLAGFTNPVVSSHGRRVSDSQRFTPLAGPAGQAPKGVAVRVRSSELAVEAHGVRVGSDGWTAPRYRRGSLSK